MIGTTKVTGVLVLLIGLMLLQGCAGVIVAGVAGATNDRRTIGQMVDDQAIELKALKAILSDRELSKATNVSVISYNGIILLVGQAKNRRYKALAARKILGIKHLRSVHNHIEVKEFTSFKEKKEDIWLAARVKSTMIGGEGLTGLNVKVIVRDKVLYLMGIITRDEADDVIDAVRGIEGLRRIVKVFEYYEEDN